MRGIIFLILLLLVLTLVGWVTFSNDSGRSSVNFETEKIKQDTEEMLEAGDGIVDRARTSLQDDQPTTEREIDIDTDGDGVTDTEIETDRPTDDVR